MWPTLLTCENYVTNARGYVAGAADRHVILCGTIKAPTQWNNTTRPQRY